MEVRSRSWRGGRLRGMAAAVATRERMEKSMVIVGGKVNGVILLVQGSSMNERLEGVRHWGRVKVASCLRDPFEEISSPFIHLSCPRFYVPIVLNLKHLESYRGRTEEVRCWWSLTCDHSPRLSYFNAVRKKNRVH
jgi:hypothetical protein